jgi:hypothetical protein
MPRIHEVDLCLRGRLRTVSVATEVEGTLDEVDVTQNPPVLKVGSGSFTLDKVKQVRRKSS